MDSLVVLDGVGHGARWSV